MAVGLGQAILAFAGGAAQQFNEDVAREQKLKDDRQKRLQELDEQAAQKQAEAEYKKRFDDWHDRQSIVRKVEAAGGAKTPAGQAQLAKYYGMSWDEVKATKSMGKLELPPEMKQPVPLTEIQRKLLSDRYDPEMVQYAKKRDLSTKVDSKGRAIPKTQIPKEDGSLDTMSVLGEVGITEDMPADVLLDGSNFSENEWSQMAEVLAGEKKEIKYDEKRKGFAVFDEGTQKATFVPAGDGGEGGEEDLPDTNLTKLQKNLAAKEDQLENTQDPKEAARLQREISQINTEIAADPLKNRNLQAELEFQNRDRNKISDLQGRVLNMQNTLDVLDRYKNSSTAATTGLPGAVLSLKASIQHNIRGLGELFGAIDTKSPSQIEQELQEAGFNYDEFVKGDLAALAGEDRTNRILTVYSLASVFKDLGRDMINNKDLDLAMQSIGGFGGKGKLAQLNRLEDFTRSKMAKVYRDLYRTPGLEVTEKRDAGVGYLQSLGWQMGTHYKIGRDNVVYVRDENNQRVALDTYLEQNPAILTQ